VVWRGWDGADPEIFLYDGTVTTQLTDNDCDDHYPQINASGCVVWEGSDIFLATPVAVVDNLDGSAAGSCGSSSNAPGYYGTNYHYHAAASGTDTFTWIPTLPTARPYEVFGRWTTGSGRAPDATFTIYHDSGSTTVSKDQRSNGGVWVSLGAFDFDDVGEEKVELVQNQDGIVIADAVRWELQP
jgi:hypothetical protein